MLDMARKQILPAVQAYGGRLARDASRKKSLLPKLSCASEQRLCRKLAEGLPQLLFAGPLTFVRKWP